MSIFRNSDFTNIRDSKKKVSTAIAKDVAVYYDGTGFVVPAVAGSTNLRGVSRETIATTDADYASTRSIGIDVPTSGDEFVIDTSADTADAQVGKMYDLASAGVLNNGATGTVKHFKMVGYVGATTDRKALVVFNPSVVYGA